MPVEMARFIGLIEGDLNALGKLGEVELEMLSVGGQHGAGQPHKNPSCIACVIKPGNLVDIVAVLTRVVQEQQKKINELEARLAE